MPSAVPPLGMDRRAVGSAPGQGRPVGFCGPCWKRSAGRSEIVDGPSVNRGKRLVELGAQRGCAGSAVVDRDFLGAQAPGALLAVVDPPGGADVEHVTGSFAIADRDHGLTPQLAAKTKVPGGPSP